MKAATPVCFRDLIYHVPHSMALIVGIPHHQTDPVVTGWTFRQAAGCGTSNPGTAIRARTGREREVPWVPW